MRSGPAHGWLIVDLINVHLSEHTADTYERDRGWPEEYTTYCPECCGPCSSLLRYWNTVRGRREAQVYLSTLSMDQRTWVWSPEGIIDWAEIERRMALGFCPNHQESDAPGS